MCQGFVIPYGTHHVFSFFRNLNVFYKKQKDVRAQVLALLLNAFRLSLRKTSSFFSELSELVSKSNVEWWTKKVKAKLSFDPAWVLGYRSWPIVKCGGPVYVWSWLM